jgi:hypothetical protein
MEKKLTDKPIIIKILKDFRFELLKALILILIFTASVLYSNVQSNKYYYYNHQELFMQKNKHVKNADYLNKNDITLP